MNKNNHIWIARYIVAMVTAITPVPGPCFEKKQKSLSRNKSERVWFSGLCEPISNRIQPARRAILPLYKICYKNILSFMNKEKKWKQPLHYAARRLFYKQEKQTTISSISPKVLFPMKQNYSAAGLLRILKFLNTVESFRSVFLNWSVFCLLNFRWLLSTFIKATIYKDSLSVALQARELWFLILI